MQFISELIIKAVMMGTLVHRQHKHIHTHIRNRNAQKARTNISYMTVKKGEFKVSEDEQLV